MGTQSAGKRRLLLVGGGHSHVIILKLLAANPLPQSRVTLVSDTRLFSYSGMLPGLVAGCYTFKEAHFDLEHLALAANAAFICGKALGLDLLNRRLSIEQAEPIDFDLLSLNLGSTPPVDSVPGAREHTISVKPVPEFLSAWEDILKEYKSGHRPKICIVGAGAGGVELSFAMRHRLGIEADVHIVHNDSDILLSHTRSVRRVARRRLEEAGIRVTVNAKIDRVEASALYNKGDQIPFDKCFWATGSAPAKWLGTSGLALDEHGFILVAPSLRSLSHDSVFAVGDIASIVYEPRPKAGVYAVRQGKPLYENLSRALSGEALKNFTFQKHFLTLMGTSCGSAIGARGPFMYEGKIMWMLKQWIDRRFMAQFR